MSKHSMRTGRLSRLSASRSSSSASTRRSRRCSVAAASDSSASCAFCVASSCSRRFSPRCGGAHLDARAAPLGQELLERLGVAAPPAGRRSAAARSATSRSTRGRTPPGPWGCPGPRRSRGGSCGGRRACRRGAGRPAPRRGRPRRRCRSRRSSRLAPVGGLPLGEVPDREQAVAVARRVLEALVRRGVEHLLLELALDRLRVAGEELDDAVDDLARSPPWRRSRRTAPGSGRCGSRGTGCPSAGRAAAPRTGRKRKTRLRTSSVSRTFFAFAYGPK